MQCPGKSYSKMCGTEPRYNNIPAIAMRIVYILTAEQHSGSIMHEFIGILFGSCLFIDNLKEFFPFREPRPQFLRRYFICMSI